MTDAQLVAKCRQIARHNSNVYDLIREIEESDHPNAQACADDLWGQCWAAAWADHVVVQYLVKPERYETGDYGIQRKVQQAKENA